MTPEQQAAYVNSQAVCALIEALGMVAENQQRSIVGNSMAYDHKAFRDLIKEYSIHHNGVLTTFGR